MHHKRMIAVAGAACALAVTPVVASAQEEQAPTPPAKTAKPLGKVKRVTKKSATLKVKYSCKTGSVLWISLKQSKSGKKDKALKGEGSSKLASAWWQSHRNPIKCDGKSHTAKFTVDKVEDGSKGRLKSGFAWLQFCVTEGDNLTVSVAKWVEVK